METKSSDHIIEVCAGPDCSRGGAALLEIEELAIESGSQYRVISGGCRNLCSMGPNVHHDGCQFGKVRSPEDCERVAKEIGMQLQYDGTDDRSSRIACMLMKKADRSRWKVLRDVARRKNTQVSKRKLDMWQEELQGAYSSELRAAQMFESSHERCQRAERRLDRLKGIVEKIVLKENEVDQASNGKVVSLNSPSQV
jgi:hypothetical protein